MIACPLGSVPTGAGPCAGCRSVKRTVTRAPGTGLPDWFFTSTPMAAGPSHGLAVWASAAPLIEANSAAASSAEASAGAVACRITCPPAGASVV